MGFNIIEMTSAMATSQRCIVKISVIIALVST